MLATNYAWSPEDIFRQPLRLIRIYSKAIGDMYDKKNMVAKYGEVIEQPYSDEKILEMTNKILVTKQFEAQAKKVKMLAKK